MRPENLTMNRLKTKTQNQCTGFLRTSVWPLYVCGSSVGILNIKIMSKWGQQKVKSWSSFLCAEIFSILAALFQEGRHNFPML